MKRFLLIVFIGIVVVVGWQATNILAGRAERQRRIDELVQISVPSARSRPASSASIPKPIDVPIASSQPRPAQPSVAAEVNWGVPFTPQAPFAHWDAVHKEACEEASALMVLRYFADRDFSSAEEADAEIVRLVEASGPAVDETAAEVADLLRSENRSLDVSLLNNPTEADLKAALASGKLIIAPAAGRELGNPYFRNPGPPYHMLVVRGYTKDGYAITNDPGTKRGENFVYRWDTLINAIHDWNGGDVSNGAKVVVVIGE